MPERGEGFNPEINRIEVDRYKQVVKDERILDPNNPGREAGALKILNDMGFKDKDDVFSSLIDKNKNIKVIEDKVGNLGVAVKEIMDENLEMKQAVVAGSYSTDKYLPETWRREKPEDPSMADVIVDGFRRDIGKGDLKTEFGMALEGVDYLMNLGEDEAFVVDQVEQSKIEINKIKVSPWEKKAMAAKMDALKYLSGLKAEVRKGVDSDLGDVEPKDAVDYRAVAENIYQQGDSKEYRSPFEITEENFVDSLFNQASPRLYFTPPPEWADIKNSTEQYILKIEQNLVNGAVTKLATKDINTEKPRMNEIYNFPLQELQLIYEKVPGVKEAMENMVNELFELYEEDGYKFLKIKEDDNTVKNKFGNFEIYKENLFKKMALEKIYGRKIGDNELGSLYNEQIIKFKEKNKDKLDQFSRLKAKGYSDTLAIKKGGWSEVEAEKQWQYKNAYEDKRAVATAWNFLFVGNIVESADINRKLKPTQVNSDKIRTFMRPLEKFLQKMSLRKGVDGMNDGTEEFFGGTVALWVKEKLLSDEGKDFAEKLRKAADGDRTKMSFDEAKWRVFPKRQFCSFVDLYQVNVPEKDKNGNIVTDKGEVVLTRKTMAEALMDRDKIDFSKKGDEDLDIFVNMRDIWDELNTVNPFLIGKGDDPGKSLSKYNLAVLKEIGLVRGINKIKKTDGTFGHLPFVDNPEYYAWLIANSFGMETNLDVPVLDRDALRSNRDNYDLKVNDLIRGIKLPPEIESKVSNGVKEILTAKNYWSRRDIKAAENRAADRETERKRAEKRQKKS